MAVPFAVTMALHALGLTDAQRDEVVNNTLPALDDLITWYNTNPQNVQMIMSNVQIIAKAFNDLLAWYNANPKTVQAIVADVQKAAKGIGYVADAASGKNMTLSQVLHLASEATKPDETQ